MRGWQGWAEEDLSLSLPDHAIGWGQLAVWDWDLGFPEGSIFWGLGWVGGDEVTLVSLGGAARQWDLEVTVDAVWLRGWPQAGG